MSVTQQKVLDDLLIEAVRNKDVAQAQLYVQKGANPKVSVPGVQELVVSGGATYSATGSAPLLHLALERWKYHLPMVEFLLSCGVDVDVKNFKGNTPLMLAVKNGNEAQVKYFLSKGADPLAVNDAREMVLDEARRLRPSDASRQTIINALLGAMADKQKTPAASAQNAPAARQEPAAPQGDIKVMKPVTIGQRRSGGGGFRL